MKIGTGYMTASIIINGLEDNKFIGYIPTKEEYIIATHDNNGGYCWTKYFGSSDSIAEYLIKDDAKSLASIVLEYANKLKD